MDMNDWVMLMTALGGIEGIKQLIKWWMSRKTNARIEDAHADVEEFKALREYNEFLQKQLRRRNSGLWSRQTGSVRCRMSYLH